MRGGHPLRNTRRRLGCTSIPFKAGSAFSRPWRPRRPAALFQVGRARGGARRSGDTDVVHFHNISLVGGPGVLGIGANRRAVRIMTAHEHWLICPMHLLWKYDRKPCDAPELRELLLERAPAAAGLAIDAARSSEVFAISTRWSFPSRHTLEEHRRRGIGAYVSLVHVPYFLPDDWSEGIENEPPRALDGPTSPRPAGW